MAMGLNILKNQKKSSWRWLLAILFLLMLSRLIPHPPNFTPLGAIALLSGAVIKDIRLALLIPLLAMLLSDAIIGFHDSMAFVYGAFIITIIAAYYWLNQLSFMTISTAAILSSLVFFMVTNLGAWLSHDMYAYTAAGLGQAYLSGIPFLKNTLLSNFIFTLAGFYALKKLSSSQTVYS